MKIFYDNQGNVMGSIDSPYEDQMTMPGHTEMVVPDHIAIKVMDPYDPAGFKDLRVADGELIIKQQRLDHP